MFNESIHQLFCSSRLSAAIDVLRMKLLHTCLFFLLMFLVPILALAAYPDASTTGVPPGTVLTPSGSITVTVPGTVLDSLDIQGHVIIDANNVTLMRSKVTSDSEHAIKIRKGRTGAIIQDCEVDGMGLNGVSGSDGITGRATVLRANIHGVREGFLLGNSSLLQDSYIHDLSAPGTGMFIGVGQDGTQHQQVLHNSVIVDLNQTATVRLTKTNKSNPSPDIVISNNRLIGGNYTVICDGTGPLPIANASFTNNSLGIEASDYKLVVNCTPVWSGNFDDITGDPVN